MAEETYSAPMRSAPMRAAARTEYGGPDVVRIVEVEIPAIHDDDVLVQVHATTVNRTDCAYRSAKPFINRFFTGLVNPRRTVLGTEFAGAVVAVGAAVTGLAAGDRVFGFSARGGAHAEYVSVRADGPLAAMPADSTYAQVAPGTEGSHYALSLIRAARIGPGQDVLVNGATGGIGSAAVQLLKAAGASVTAVCGTEHAELVRGLGADRVVDYTAVDFTRDEGTYDVVLDAVGKSTFGRCRRLLRPDGIYLSSDLGPLGQNPLLALVTPLRGGRKVLFPVPRQTAETVGYLRKLIESGEFRPVVDRRYPLDRIAEAYRYVDTGRKVGNVVIDVR
jgi:NADPH:quinone reductase-like Zn-dependent oxidoreductase